MKSGSGAADLEFGRDSVRMKVDDPLKTKIEAAHYAPIAVSAKHVFAELRIPFRLGFARRPELLEQSLERFVILRERDFRFCLA
jgi:hypothetical protein